MVQSRFSVAWRRHWKPSSMQREAAKALPIHSGLRRYELSTPNALKNTSEPCAKRRRVKMA